jgi:phosphohistidine phosphatase SixA
MDMHATTLNDAEPRNDFGHTGGVRYLTIVRHAKATPATPMGSDFERPLNGRGKKQCKQLRQWALDEQSLGRFGPVSALVSSAERTRETFERSFEGTPWVLSQEFEKSIYGGVREVTGRDLLQALIEFDPVGTSLLLIGHNPSMHELAELLASEVPDSLRSRGYALGGAYVFALPDAQPIGFQRYEVVASFIPD